jgi:hypothetical protein
VSVEICDLFEDNINDALYVCTSDELRDCRHDSVYPASCYTLLPNKEELCALHSLHLCEKRLSWERDWVKTSSSFTLYPTRNEIT